MDDNVQTYKSRLVSKCYKQRKWADFDEILSSVAMLKSIRVFACYCCVVPPHGSVMSQRPFLGKFWMVFGCIKESPSSKENVLAPLVCLA